MLKKPFAFGLQTVETFCASALEISANNTRTAKGPTSRARTPSSSLRVYQQHCPKLVARWVLEDEKLVCKWDTTDG